MVWEWTEHRSPLSRPVLIGSQTEGISGFIGVFKPKSHPLGLDRFVVSVLGAEGRSFEPCRPDQPSLFGSASRCQALALALYGPAQAPTGSHPMTARIYKPAKTALP